MTSQLLIGRIGTDIATNAPITYDLNGDELSLDGKWFVASAADAIVLRQQLNGYVRNPWERYPPIQLTTDPAITGYYQFAGATVTTDNELLASGLVKFKAKATRLQNYAIGRAEGLILNASRAHHGTVTPSPWVGIPTTWSGIDYGAIAVIGGASRNLLNGGAVQIFEPGGATFNDALGTAFVSPANWYDGQALLEIGSPLRAAIGRQLPAGVVWRLSNGLMDINSTSGSDNSFTIKWTNTAGNAQSTARKFVAAFYNPGTGRVDPLPAGVTPRSLTVLRNSPECVSIRLAYDIYSDSTGSVFVDLTLRRGSRYVGVFISSSNEQYWGIAFDATKAMTAMTGGVSLKETVASSPGVCILAGPNLYGNTTHYDNVQGQVYTDGPAAGAAPPIVFDGAIGCEITSPNNPPDLAAQVNAQYFAALTESWQIRPL